jgi:hypothetical protein
LESLNRYFVETSLTVKAINFVAPIIALTGAFVFALYMYWKPFFWDEEEVKEPDCMSTPHRNPPPEAAVHLGCFYWSY